MALRLFRSVVSQRDIPCSRFERVLENIGEMARMVPHDVEWAELRKIVHTWLDRITLGCYFTCSSILLSRPQLWVHVFFPRMFSIDPYFRLVILSFDGTYPAIQGWIDRLNNPVDYAAHALLHWIVTQSNFKGWTCTEKKTSDLYQSLRPFINPCDMALGQIASELNICPSADFCEEHLRKSCSTLLTSVSR